MNCTSHCSQSHFSLAEQGCRGSFPKRYHQSENTITCFQSKLKHCCQWPLEGGLWSCSQLLPVWVGIPKQVDAGVPKYCGDRLQLDTPNRLCWAWNFYLLIPSHAPSPCSLAAHVFGCCDSTTALPGGQLGPVGTSGPEGQQAWAQSWCGATGGTRSRAVVSPVFFLFVSPLHFTSLFISSLFLAMHNIGGYAWGFEVSVW